MSIHTPGVLPATVLLQQGRPAWLDRWASFAAGLAPGDLPGPVRARTRLVLLDSLGVIAAGMQEPEMQALLARTAARGTGPAPAVGGGLLLPAPAAGFLNGTAGTMLELDEGNQYARGHPGIHVVPAVLAASAGRRTSGAALLAAVALGYEVGARIGIASRLRVAMHPHGTWGTVGAALAVAHLDGAGAEEVMQAINVASSFGLSTSRRTMLEGATVRNSYAGLSNQLGLTAWDLVRAGFTGETDGVGAVYGGIIAEDFRPDAMTNGLGARWEIARNYFKRHAACRYTHAALDALAILLAREGPLDPGAVERIEVDTYVWAAQLDLPAPDNMLSAKFSLPFALATSLVHGAASVAAFRAPALRDPRVLALAARVAVREDPSLTAGLPGLRPARLCLLLRDGRRLHAAVETNRGDAEDPYEADDIVAKFHELADPVWGAEQARRIAAAVDALDGSADVAPLHALLAAPPRGEGA